MTGKIIEVTITQENIDEVNKLRKKLKLPPTKKKAGDKFEVLFK